MARLVIFTVGLLFAPTAFANILRAVSAAADTAKYLNTYQVPLNRMAKLALGYPKENVQNFTEVAGEFGYQTEEHKIVTEDGYILTVFRIAAQNCTGTKGTPVLLMHGVFQNSDSFIAAGPGSGLAYLLADSCYDTWVGNCRGTNYGRAHKTLNPDKDAAFWKFSADEIGYYDVPAHIDYILDYTGFNKLNYVGFSQGGGGVLIANSERPEYNEKLNVIVALAPATRILNTKSPLFRLLAGGVFKLEDFLAVGGIQEVLFRGSALQTLLEFLCQMKSVLGLPYELCKGFLYVLDSYNPNDEITPEITRRLYSQFPAGTSVQQLSRYAQGLKVPFCQKYDFGSDTENLAHYGTTTPPIYDFSKVTTPVVITYGANDHLVDPLDVMWLKEQLPNVLELKLVDDPNWNHIDNTYSSKIAALVYPTVDKYISQYTQK